MPGGHKFPPVNCQSALDDTARSVRKQLDTGPELMCGFIALPGSHDIELGQPSKEEASCIGEISWCAPDT